MSACKCRDQRVCKTKQLTFATCTLSTGVQKELIAPGNALRIELALIFVLMNLGDVRFSLLQAIEFFVTARPGARVFARACDTCQASTKRTTKRTDSMTCTLVSIQVPAAAREPITAALHCLSESLLFLFAPVITLCFAFV